MTLSTRWWWIRHAPVVGPADRIHGQADVACDTSDAEAFAALGRLLPEGGVYVVTPLRRTRQTLDAVAGSSLPAVVEADFAEQSFGAWQGLTWAGMQAQDPDAYRSFWIDPTRTAPPGGESFAGLMARTRHAVERLGRDYAGRDIVVVAHGGTIRAAVAMALDLSPEAAMAIVIDNLSLTRLDHVGETLLQGRGGGWRVSGVNIPCRWIPAKPL